MRVLIAGDYHAAIHESALEKAFRALGHEPHSFPWHHYFGREPWGGARGARTVSSLIKKTEERFLNGPTLKRLNRDLIAACRDLSPDLLFIYRGTHIYPQTLRSVRRFVGRIFGYNNDDPFSRQYPRYFWRHFVRGIPAYDHVFAYRLKNVAELRAAGARAVSLLRSYYIAELNYPIPAEHRLPGYDVVFAGHYEPDGRDEALLALYRAGVAVRLFGPRWHESPSFESLRNVYESRVPRSAEYNATLNRAKIALVFLSSLNNDTYTRRCFEIPAVGTFMLSQYSDDLAQLFAEGAEAEYFRSGSELIDKVRYYLSNPAERQRIADAGRQRLLRDGHEVTDRVRQIIQTFNEVQN